MRIPVTVQLIGGAIALGSVYELAVMGKLGPILQDVAKGMPLTPPATDPGGVPLTNTSTVGTGLQLPGPYADESALVANNSSFLSLVQSWKYGTLATNAGNFVGSGGPYDWASFQQTLVRLGYPDPGPLPTLNFARL